MGGADTTEVYFIVYAYLNVRPLSEVGALKYWRSPAAPTAPSPSPAHSPTDDLFIRRRRVFVKVATSDSRVTQVTHRRDSHICSQLTNVNSHSYGITLNLPGSMMLPYVCSKVPQGRLLVWLQILR